MSAARSVHRVEYSPVCLTPCPCPQGEPQPLPPTPVTSTGDSPSPAGRSSLGAYQINAFVLVLAHVRLCVPFKSETSISASPVGLLQLSPIGLQRQILGTRLPGARPMGWGARRGAQDSHSCGRTSAI